MADDRRAPHRPEEPGPEDEGPGRLAGFRGGIEAAGAEGPRRRRRFILVAVMVVAALLVAALVLIDWFARG